MARNLPINTTEEAGLAIRERRRAQGIDQMTLANRAGVSRKWLVGVETGRPRADFGLILKTLRALGLNLTIMQHDGGASGDRPDIDPRALDIDAAIAKTKAP